MGRARHDNDRSMLQYARYLITTIVALVLLVSPPQPTIAASSPSGQLRGDVTFASTTLGRAIRAAVYLPAAYFDRRHPDKRFPVAYLLHGLGDDHTAWPRLGRIKPTLDRIMARGQLRPFIAVMPDAGRSWYVNDARPDGYGAIFDAFRADLIKAADKRFRTLPCSGARTIGGLSMGGYGALILGTAQPLRYAAVFSLSGAVFAENLADDPKRRERLAQLFGGVHGVPLDARRLRSWSIFERLKALAPQAPGPSVWLSAGDHDAFPSIVTGSVRVYDIVRRRRWTAELRIDDAGHDWAYWQKSIVPALTWAASQLTETC